MEIAIYIILFGNLITSIFESFLFFDAIRKQRTAFVYFFGIHIAMTISLIIIVLLYWSRV